MWNEAATEALLISVRVSLVGTIFTILLGVPISLWLARNRKPYAFALDGFLSLPLVVPPVVTGYLLLLMFSPAGPLGAFLANLGIRVALDWKGAVIASSLVAFPLFITVARVAFEKCDPLLEEAALTLNASRARIFVTITLPQALPGIAAASAVTFARAFGEFGATMTFAGNIPGQTRTVPQAIFSEMLSGNDTAALGMTLVSLGIGIAAMVISQVLIHRNNRTTSGNALNA